jgi:hypothetical protein
MRNFHALSSNGQQRHLGYSSETTTFCPNELAKEDAEELDDRWCPSASDRNLPTIIIISPLHTAGHRPLQLLAVLCKLSIHLA